MAPVDGEHPVSWLTRWAYRYGLSPGQLLTGLGTPAPAAPMARIEKHLRRHRTVIARAAGLTGLPTGFDTDQRAGLLDRYMAGYHDLRRAPVNRTRFCPACLAESGGAWRREWTLALQLVCSRHQVLLVRCCPDCRRQRFASPAWMTSTSPPWVCSEPVPDSRTHRTRSPACGRDLRTVPAVPASLADIVLQARLWHLTDEAAEEPEETTEACGFEVTRRDLFDAVLELTVEHLGEPGPLYRMDTDPTATIAAVRVAFTVVDQADAATAADLADQHRLLHPTGTVTPIGPDQALTRRRRNPLLASIRLGCLGPALSPSSQLVFRTASGRPRYPTARTSPTGPPPPGTTRLAWIPQQLWSDQLTPWILNGDHRGRAAAAVMLAKVGSTRPWRAIAVDLGLPASFASYPPTLVRNLQRGHVWPAVVARLDELATGLEADPPPINYQTRRWTAASQDLLVAAVNHARAELGPVDGWVSTHLLTEVFWQVYTGGSLRLAAPTEGTFLNPDLYPDDEGTRVGVLTDPDLVRFLTLVADLLAGATGRSQPEPLTWQPPSRTPTAAALPSLSPPTLRYWANDEVPVEVAAAAPGHDQAIIRAVVLALGEEHMIGSGDLTRWIESYLDTIYGISHPDALARLTPTIRGTHHAVIGRQTSPDPIDHLIHRQLQHTLRYPGGTIDVRWNL